MALRRQLFKYKNFSYLCILFVIIISLKLINLSTKRLAWSVNMVRDLDRNTTLGIQREGDQKTQVQTLILYGSPQIDEQNEPVDLVYLWANGSDPRFILDMKRQKASDEPEKYQRSLNCSRRSMFGEYFHVIVVYPGVPQTKVIKGRDNIKLMFNVTDNDMEYTVIVPQQNELVGGIMNVLTEIEGQMYLCMCGYITNINTKQAKRQLINMYILKSVNRTSQMQELKRLEESFGVIEQEEVSDKSEIYTFIYAKQGIQGETMTKGLESLDMSKENLKTAILVWDADSIIIDGIKKKPNTFEDNNQLRFSLRSVEKYAPWLQHIYIITNEQIPYWLNTSNNRISVVFTKDLLPNKNDLPTFSSPVIESYMHRIPGLSETFLFMCDDFFLGQKVQLRDFYTEEEGFKFRWDGRLPFCVSECSHFDLGNGVCNKGCNTVKCGFDHGDCSNLTKSDMRIPHPVGLHYGSLYHTMAMFNRKKSLFDISEQYLMPPHRPLLVNKNIAKDMEKIFHEEFQQSSSLHFRSQFNIQYTMAYMKYVSSALVSTTSELIFDQLEESRPGLVSYKMFENFIDTTLAAYLGNKADAIRNVSLQCIGRNSNEGTEELEVPKHLLSRCPAIVEIITQAKLTKLKYKHRIVIEQDSHFIMLAHLKDSKRSIGMLQKSPRKFNGVNDNLDHTKKESAMVLKLLRDFFMSLFPTPSQFELKKQPDS